MELSYILFVLLLGCNFTYKDVEGLKGEKIINGNEKSLRQFRHVAALIYKVKNRPDVNPCAGGILNSWYIAAVAHCFFDKLHGTYINKEFFIVVSTLNIWTTRYTTKYLGVDLVIIPNYYQPNTADSYDTRGDLAIVKSTGSMGYMHENHEHLRSLVIPGPELAHEDLLFYVSGFGWNEIYPPTDDDVFPTGSTDGTVRYAYANVLNDDECESKIGGYLAEGNMCAQILIEDNKHMGICVGDGGGPLIHRNFLKGIAITGFLDCDEREHPGIYINTTYYADFINNAKNGIYTDEMTIVQMTHENGEHTFEPYQQP